MSTAKQSEGVVEMLHPNGKHVMRIPYGPRFRDGVGRLETIARFKAKGYKLPDEAAAEAKAKQDAAELAELRAAKKRG